MPPLAFTLALAAAVLHAFWNILLARARDPESATAVALLAAVIVFAPVTALRFDAEWAVWPFIVVTSLLQLLYFALLATAYRKAELSFVYPVARGVAPAIVLVVVSRCARVLHVGRSGCRRRPRRGRRAPRPWPTPPFPSACPRLCAGDRLCHRVLHAAGQAWDHACKPDHVPRAEHGSGGARLRRGHSRRQGRPASGPSSGVPAVLAGIASFTAYALVLAALARASAASVAAVRETSVVMATVFAAVVLHERVSRSRLAGSVIVVGGIALLALR